MAHQEKPKPSLHEAIKARNEELVRILVKFGCNDRDSNGSTPLHLVATRPFTKSLNSWRIKFVPMDEEEVQYRVRIANLLIDAGANIDSASSSDFILGFPVLNTPLREAALCQNHAIVKLLLQCGADVNSKTLVNTTLHLAMTHFQGNLDLLKILLDHGSDVNAVNRRGDTPLHMAVKHPTCSAELIQLFLERGADINAKARQTGNTALHLAMNRFLESIKNDDAQVSTLENGREQVNLVKVLLSRGSDVNAVNRLGDTPLHVAVKHPTQCSVELINLLLEHGVDINLKSRYLGNTALHYAVTHYQENPDLVKTLLEHSDVNAVNNGVGETPLHFAVKHPTQCSVELIELFLKQRVNIHAKSRRTGNTALHLAMLHFQNNVDLVKLLLEHSDVNAVNVRGETPLHLAAEIKTACSAELIELLLKHGADVDKKRKCYSDEYAFQMYIAAHLPTSVDPTLLKLLLPGNNPEEDDRMSPLHDACLFHQVDSVRKLLLGGADPAAIDSFGHIPMFYALISHQPDKEDCKRSTVKLMIDFSADLDQKCIFPRIGHLDYCWSKVVDKEIFNIFYNYALMRMELHYGVDGKILPKFFLHELRPSNRGNCFLFTYMLLWHDKLRSLLQSSGFDNFYICELRLMRDTMVGESAISFLDLLENNEEKMIAAYRGNYKQLVEDFEAGKSKFKVYKDILEATFYKNHNERIRVIKLGVETLRKLLQEGRIETINSETLRGLINRTNAR